MTKRRYSASALTIIILLILILVQGIFMAITLPQELFQNDAELIGTYIFLIILIFIYLFALLGVVRKTRWGLVLTIVLSIIDILAIVVSRGYFSTIYQDLLDLLFDFTLLILSINIIKRIK